MFYEVSVLEQYIVLGIVIILVAFVLSRWGK